VRRITDDLPMCEALRSGDVQISVVIPTYCRCYLLKRTTEALKAQVGPMRYEVIWADDGSSDATENILRSAVIDRPDLFRYIRLERSGAPSLPRNEGIRRARGTIIVTLDNDIVPDLDFVLQHWRFHEQHREENIGAIGELYLSPEEARHPMSLFSSFPYKEVRRRKKLDFLFFWAGNLSVKRSFMLKHGMYRVDPELTLLEDMECGYRMFRSGLRLSFLPSARGQHVVERLTVNDVAEKGYHTGKTQYRLLELVPEVSIKARFGVLSRDLGTREFLWRLVRRGAFRLIDNSITAGLLVLLGARGHRRTRVTDFYYRLIFRRNMVAGYDDARRRGRRVTVDVVSEARS
jgi:glycosyltransferase involved in cell wall biosynthesis